MFKKANIIILSFIVLLFVQCGGKSPKGGSGGGLPPEITGTGWGNGHLGGGTDELPAQVNNSSTLETSISKDAYQYYGKPSGYMSLTIATASDFDIAGFPPVVKVKKGDLIRCGMVYHIVTNKYLFTYFKVEQDDDFRAADVIGNCRSTGTGDNMQTLPNPKARLWVSLTPQMATAADVNQYHNLYVADYLQNPSLPTASNIMVGGTISNSHNFSNETFAASFDGEDSPATNPFIAIWAFRVYDRSPGKEMFYDSCLYAKGDPWCYSSGNSSLSLVGYGSDNDPITHGGLTYPDNNGDQIDEPVNSYYTAQIYMMTGGTIPADTVDTRVINNRADFDNAVRLAKSKIPKR